MLQILGQLNPYLNELVQLMVISRTERERENTSFFSLPGLQIDVPGARRVLLQQHILHHRRHRETQARNVCSHSRGPPELTVRQKFSSKSLNYQLATRGWPLLVKLTINGDLNSWSVRTYRERKRGRAEILWRRRQRDCFVKNEALQGHIHIHHDRPFSLFFFSFIIVVSSLYTLLSHCLNFPNWFAEPEVRGLLVFYIIFLFVQAGVMTERAAQSPQVAQILRRLF